MKFIIFITLFFQLCAASASNAEIIARLHKTFHVGGSKAKTPEEKVQIIKSTIDPAALSELSAKARKESYPNYYSIDELRVNRLIGNFAIIDGFASGVLAIRYLSEHVSRNGKWFIVPTAIGSEASYNIGFGHAPEPRETDRFIKFLANYCDAKKITPSAVNYGRQASVFNKAVSLHNFSKGIGDEHQSELIKTAINTGLLKRTPPDGYRINHLPFEFHTIVAQRDGYVIASTDNGAAIFGEVKKENDKMYFVPYALNTENNFIDLFFTTTLGAKAADPVVFVDKYCQASRMNRPGF